MNRLRPLLLFIALLSAPLCRAQQGAAMIMELSAGNKQAHDSDIEKTRTALQARLERMSFNHPVVTFNTSSNSFIAELPLETDSAYYKRYILKKSDVSLHETYSFESVMKAFEAIYQAGLSGSIYGIKMPAGKNFFDLLQIPTEPVDWHLGTVSPENRTIIDSIFKQPQVKALFPPDFSYTWIAELYGKRHCFLLTGIKKNPVIDRSMIDSVYAYLNPYQEGEITFVLKPVYHTLWADISRQNIGRGIAIITDPYVSAPRVAAEIPSGRFSLTSTMTERQARAIAAVIQYPLPLQLRVSSIKFR